ncbi:GtrA family protein [Trichococcus alkaliphilus]|uniref:GtrA family protein n=1 Tax=Trichococcus alkaliphilus TaxID=2052943 RepID=UPI000D0B2A7B|nr:GtrA family protein [Trichococcus alkaliphilus]
MTKLLGQVVKFGLVGVVATLLDFLVLYILADFIGLHYLTAAALAFVAATLFNYAASMRYVFTSRFGAAEKRQELLLFVTLSVIGLGLNQALMWLFVDQVEVHYLVAKIAATVFVMAWNFISRKIWLEDKNVG